MTFVLLAGGIYPFSSPGLLDEVLWQSCLGDNTINLTTQPSPSQGAHGPLGGSVVRRVSSTASCSIKMTDCPFATFSPGVPSAYTYELFLPRILVILMHSYSWRVYSSPVYEPSLLPPTPSLGLSAVSVMNSNCGWVYGLSYGAPETQTNQGMWLDICLCPLACYHS